MSKTSMHIAFEAARLLETEAMLGLWHCDSFVDPDVDAADRPYVLISVAQEMYIQAAHDIPESVIVLNQEVPVIVKPLSMRMN